ncbi:MAG: hypothetical protein HY700_22105 [Gemmatimonadetes bacterium]|nr:hypothetical protein [Gemmatimonadota bacterium]
MKLASVAAAVAIAASATPPAAAQDSATVAAGARYGAGSLHRFFFGPHYRDLWTTPVRVELLDVRTVAGGLTPTTAGGRLQSRSLRFRASDGRQFSFRLIDKNPIEVLPEDLRRTIAADIVQDQTSAGHPASSVVVGPLLDAVGVLHADLRFVVLRDVPVLSDTFRAEFAGKLGTWEERILPPQPGRTGFAGATRIENGDTLFAILARDPRERVDARRLLTARLMDLFIGDPDRHRLQWGWAKSGPTPGDPWLPIPEDRDQALIRYDGFFLMLVRSYYPEVLTFGNRYGKLVGTTRAGSELDRKLLSGLTWPTWDSVASEIRTRVTDQVIEGAVAQMPREYWPLDSARLARTLKIRRDGLQATARAFYSMLAREADIHATDAAERVTIERLPDGSLDLRIVDSTADTPLLARRYSPGETRDLRLYLNGGDDHVTVKGDGPASITLRIIGGDGNDVLVDSAGDTRFYDQSGDNRAMGRTTSIDRRPFIPPIDPPGPLPKPRDFGGEWRWLPWFTYSSDFGVLGGGSVSRYDYGFRKLPYSSRVTLKAGYATRTSAFRLDLSADARRQNSGTHTTLFARASQLEIIRFHGFGNDVVAAAPQSFYRVNQEQLILHSALAFPLGATVDAGVGPVLRYARTGLQPGGIISLTRPYGAEGFGTHEGFGQLGGRAWANLDVRNRPIAATSGVHLAAEGNVYPAFWDVRSTFGEVHAEGATYFTLKIPLQPTFAFRAGGKKVWGTYPFHEAAYVGGAGTLRGFPLQRFAGDASLFGSAELRLFLAKVFLLLPANFGIFGLGDIGRVYLRGESSDTWHRSVGGGIWLAFLGRGNTLSVALARSRERTGVYFGTGFGF